MNIKIIECIPAPIKLFSSINSPILSILPGTVSNDEQQILVYCGNNTALQLITIQLEGKKPTNVESFINGYPNFINSTLH